VKRRRGTVLLLGRDGKVLLVMDCGDTGKC
jgi:hypothetical protein